MPYMVGESTATCVKGTFDVVACHRLEEKSVDGMKIHIYGFVKGMSGDCEPGGIRVIG